MWRKNTWREEERWWTKNRARFESRRRKAAKSLGRRASKIAQKSERIGGKDVKGYRPKSWEKEERWSTEDWISLKRWGEEESARSSKKN